MGNLNAEGHIFAAEIAFCHIPHLLFSITDDIVTGLLQKSKKILLDLCFTDDEIDLFRIFIKITVAIMITGVYNTLNRTFVR
jgi:hypothetical protein